MAEFPDPVRRPPGPTGTSTLAKIGLAAGLLAGAVAVFGVTLQFGFVGLDDERLVVNNRAIQQGLSLETLRFAASGVVASSWHPLTWLSFALDHALYGLDPAGFHATNVALHLLNVLLVFVVFERATRAPWPSALLAALFAWHPLHVEPVAWVSERKELLAATFGLLAIACHLSWVRRGGAVRYAGIALCLALSLLAKAMWVTLPLLLLALDHWPLGRLAEAPWRRLREKLPLLALSALASVATLVSQQTAMAPSAGVGLPERAANALLSSVRYLGKAFWPTGLSVMYPHPSLPGGEGLDALAVAGAALTLALLGALAWRLRAHAYVPAGLAWYALALMPVIGLVQVGVQAMADRYTYVPLLGVFWILAFGARDLWTWLVPRSRPAAHALAVAIALALLALGLRSADQVQAWRDTITLYERSLAATPDSPTMRFNLGNRLLERGDDDAALAHYEVARRLQPDWAPPAVSLAWLLATSADPGIRDPERAVRLAGWAVSRESPPDPNSLDTLAAAQAAQGDFAAAEATARRAVEGALARGRIGQARTFESRRRLFASGRAYLRSVAGETSISNVR